MCTNETSMQIYMPHVLTGINHVTRVLYTDDSDTNSNDNADYNANNNDDNAAWLHKLSWPMAK